MSRLKLCFIGGGNHAQRFIYPCLAAAPDTDLVAVCTRSQETAERTRRRQGAERGYCDYRLMLEREKPDAVFIVGPPRLHYEAGMHCLEKRIPFFIEKPSGENLAQSRDLAAKAAASGCFGQVGYMMRHSAVINQVRAICAAENTGELLHGTVKYFTSGPYRSSSVYGLEGSDDLSFLRRYLLVQAVHPVNLAASFLGDIVELASDLQFSGENLVLELRLRDSAGARMRVLLHTLIAPGYGNLQFKTDLFFANRTMICTEDFHALDYYPPKAPKSCFPTHHGNALRWQFAAFGNNNVKMGYESEVLSFLDCVRKGEQPADGTTLADSLKTMSLLDQLYNSVAATKAEA